jgi:ABC-type polysaccharide/polyol phosphate transport system ATPase subunit
MSSRKNWDKWLGKIVRLPIAIAIAMKTAAPLSRMKLQIAMQSMFIQFDTITKLFAGVTALDNVSLSIARGECHALMGENGAESRRSAKSSPASIAPTAGQSGSTACR